MRWLHIGTGLLVLAVLTGCPSEFGKDGRIDRAVHEDVMDTVRQRCSPEEEKQFCSDGREHSKECREHCGE